MEYRVRWEIDLDADNPLEAARAALEIMQRIDIDRSDSATVFEVQDSLTGRWVDLDLHEEVS